MQEDVEAQGRYFIEHAERDLYIMVWLWQNDDDDDYDDDDDDDDDD